MLDSVPEDSCCQKPLMRALLAGAEGDEFCCPRCGCTWRPKRTVQAGAGAVRIWEPDVDLAILPHVRK